MALPVSPVLLIGYCMLCLGELFHIIGTATTHWIENGPYANEGLFQECSPKCREIEYVSNKLKTVRVLVILGVLIGIVSVALATVILINRITMKHVSKLTLIACMLTGILTFIFTMAGIIVFVLKIYDNLVDHGQSDLVLGYSFGLPCAGAILIVVAGILVLIGGRQSLTGEYSPLLGSR